MESDESDVIKKFLDVIDANKIPKCRRPKPKPRGKSFEKGHKFGVRFGEGQPRHMTGRPKGQANEANEVLEEMKKASKILGASASKFAERITLLALREDVDPKHQFPFLKEAMLRVFGQPKSSMEDTLSHINDKVDKLYELNMPLLEATAMSDGIGIVRELLKQGKLDDVVDKIRGEDNE